MYLYRLKLWPVFLIGFGIGFLLALILFAAQDLFNNISICQKSSLNLYSTNRNDLKWFMSDTWIKREITIQSWKDSTNMTYSKWLNNRKLRSKNIDMDTYLYGPESREELEAEWLKSNIHITCIVFVKKVKLARSIQDTWGKHCNKIYFFGQVKDPKMPIINFDTKLVSSWQLLCEAFRYVWKSSETLEWLIFVKDDTLVVLENLRYMLGPLNHTQDHYLGHAVTLWGQPYNVADAGYVISVGVLRKLIKMFDNSEKCVISGKYWKQEDYYLGKFFITLDIPYLQNYN